MGMAHLIPLAPLITLPTSLFFIEDVFRAPQAPLVLCLFSIGCALYTILNAPTDSPVLNFMNGFLSIIHIVRHIQLLLVYDLHTLYRVTKVPPLSSLYVWQGFPAELTLDRLKWVADLTLNIRATGWSHGGDKCLPSCHPGSYKGDFAEPFRIAQPFWALGEDRKQVLHRSLRVLLFVYIWLDGFQFLTAEDGPLVWLAIMSGFYHIGIPLPAVIRIGTPQLASGIASVVSLALLLEAIHAFSVIVGVCMLTRTVLGTWGEAWMYPPLTGLLELSKLNVQESWSNWWHNYLRHPFLSVAEWMTPTKYPPAVELSLIMSIPFFISGIAHAAGSYAASASIRASALEMRFFCAQPLLIAVRCVVLRRVRHISHAFLASMLQKSVDVLLLVVWARATPNGEGIFYLVQSVKLPYSLWRSVFTVL